MRKQLTTLCLIIAVSLVAACAPLEPASNQPMPREQLKVDADVLYTLTVSELVHSRVNLASGDSLLHIQFAVEAHDDSDLEWNVTWFDANGMVVPGVGEGYRRAHILRGQTRYFAATAPASRVVDFQLHLREKSE